MSAALQRLFSERGVACAGIAPGATAPLRFSGATAEHLAVRRAAGLFDFSFMGCADIAGRDALGLLHRLQTRNLGRLAPGRIAYTLLLRPDGTVLNDATVWRLGERRYALFVGRRADLDLVHLAARGRDAAVTDRSGDHAVLAVQGPRSRAVLERCLGKLPALPYFGFASIAFRGAACWIARIGYSGEAGYEIVVRAADAAALWNVLHDGGAALGLLECGSEAMDTLRIEAGYILFARELRSHPDPFELGLERLVSYYHHDFIGFSCLRSRRWQAPQRRLVGLLPDAPDARPPRRAAGPGARLTSAGFSPLFRRTLALGYVRWQDRYPGTRVLLEDGTGATVARLPFYDPGKTLPRRG
jgi:aminomethyltransferase